MDMITFLKTIGYFGTWAALFTEGAVFFGIFLPGDSLLFPIGLLAGQGVFNLWIMLPGCFIAAFLGNLVGYEIGKRYGMPFLKKYAGKIIKDHQIEKCHNFFVEYGPFAVVVARFIHFARTLAPFLAGVSRMDYRLFVLYSALGAALWAAGIPLLGYFVGHLIPDGAIDHYLLPFIAFVILLMVAPKLYRKFRPSRNMGTDDAP
ncbi:MAG: DedA family protein [Alphaproteobacteria bacterium]|nr:DedA family protein [Alphaproteobacteria bacterium]